MTIVVYDGSFEGLLTAIFVVYEYKLNNVNIKSNLVAADSFFNQSHIVQSNSDKAFRVMTMLQKKLSKQAVKDFFAMFLSEENNIENMLLYYVQQIIISNESVEKNYGNKTILALLKIVRKVYRERHRMEAFIRFKQTKDNLFYATIEPDFNVLPLVIHHFTNRYANQFWLIYDVQRKYGIYYNKQDVEYVFFDAAELKNNLQHEKESLHENEIFFQDLWKQYFSSTNIKARKNTKLHTQHVPKRYWKYLIEKQ